MPDNLLNGLILFEEEINPVAPSHDADLFHRILNGELGNGHGLYGGIVEDFSSSITNFLNVALPALFAVFAVFLGVRIIIYLVKKYSKT